MINKKSTILSSFYLRQILSAVPLRINPIWGKVSKIATNRPHL